MKPAVNANDEWTPEALKAWREKHDLVQADMAQMLGIRENSYGRLERGVARIRKPMNLLMLQILGKPPKV